MIKKKGMHYYVICPETKSLKGVYPKKEDAEKADKDLKAADGDVKTSEPKPEEQKKKARKQVVRRAAGVRG